MNFPGVVRRERSAAEDVECSDVIVVVPHGPRIEEGSVNYALGRLAWRLAKGRPVMVGSLLLSTLPDTMRFSDTAAVYDADGQGAVAGLQVSPVTELIGHTPEQVLCDAYHEMHTYGLRAPLLLAEKYQAPWLHYVGQTIGTIMTAEYACDFERPFVPPNLPSRFELSHVKCVLGAAASRLRASL